jgi:hypothetical protein
MLYEITAALPGDLRICLLQLLPSLAIQSGEIREHWTGSTSLLLAVLCFAVSCTACCGWCRGLRAPFCVILEGAVISLMQHQGNDHIFHDHRKCGT